jgi:hypothetical protein
MPDNVYHRFSIVLVLLLLAGLLAACGGEPTLVPTQPPTQAPTSTTFTSPLPQPTATSLAVVLTLEPATPMPKDTPHPDRTPVAIVKAVIEPDLEIITIKNISSEVYDLSGWILFNMAAQPVFRFPEGVTLQPGDSVEVYSAVAEADVPEGGLFWTEEKVWAELPANILLLNQNTRLMFWHVHYGDERDPY